MTEKINCKRYIIFSGERYYPYGGWWDYYDEANTIEEAKIAYEVGIKRNGWAHVVDLKNKQIILDNRNLTGMPIENSYIDDE